MLPKAYFYRMKHIFLLFFAVSIIFSAPSCSRKSGCPAETAQAKVDKNGEYKANKTKSGLMSKKMMKRMKK